MKEVVWALQQMARLDAQGSIDPSMKQEWEKSFLGLLHRLSTADDVNPVGALTYSFLLIGDLSLGTCIWFDGRLLE